MPQMHSWQFCVVPRHETMLMTNSAMQTDGCYFTLDDGVHTKHKGMKTSLLIQESCEDFTFFAIWTIWLIDTDPESSVKG